MDAQHFGVFVSSLTAGASRRGALTGLLGGVLAAVATWSGVDSADKKGKKKKKKSRKQGCPPAQECGGKCGSCPGVQECCDGTCFNTATSVLHCGDCDTACDADETCESGACLCGEVQCAAAFTCCDGQCVNTSTDATNCGNCGKACLVNEFCDGGGCATLGT